VVRLARDTGRIVRGDHEIAPSPQDRRFADPAWTTNPAYRRLARRTWHSVMV
jgi:polyhydroxyalkanoate synthase subunit PhaC